MLHENEPARQTTTSRIIKKAIPNTKTFIWKRTEEPKALIELLNKNDGNAWLLFPADRPNLVERKKTLRPSKQQKTIIIVPDGTWKEVRKIVRKSPWLDRLPLLAFDPQTPSRYDLRRNPDADHLCTAETVIELFKLCDEDTAAKNLEHAFDHFLENYKRSKQNH